MTAMNKPPARIKICSLNEIRTLISKEAGSKKNSDVENDVLESHALENHVLKNHVLKNIVAKEFVIKLPDSNDEIEVFIVARQQSNNLHLFCYKNQCPHTLVNLNWQPDQFLSLDRTRIQCSMHGALFRINDGFCEWGPCQGRALQSIQTEIENEVIFVLL